ncbi:S-layer homology domain-containing protein [Paenibacillus algorifonticola]|uniref:S-layer homology domain-containing protein n=1 Tax=Paenibacillus algorifonticola TaxID=684063 RepID=A0A1I2I931_9BACL|nr:S-layer homology domain-containing protein [Paenibacillus algorifonticola]SFF38802.1 S-layer homology domain-containing protein [Paenibacillus algorifonticola]
MRKWKQMLSLFLSIALIVTLAPLQPAKAASIYFQFTDFSTVEASPTIVNTSTVDLRGSFSDVSANSITFKVERLVNGAVVATSNGALTPSIVGNTFLFAGVQLYEGLNKITVTGMSSSISGNGGTVEGVSYVSYGNVPVISSIALADGTVLQEGQSKIVTTARPSLIVKAANATEVLINGTSMFNGGAGTFVTSDLQLQLGLNKLQIVSRNGDKSYTLNRELVYFQANTPVAYNVFANTTQLDGNPIISPISNQTVTGKLLFSTPATATAAPTVTLELIDDTATVVSTHTATVTAGTSNSNYTEFNFTSDTAISAASSGKYQLRVRSSIYSGQEANFPVDFTVRTATAPYITGLKQVYDATESGSTVNYTSSGIFSNNAVVSQLPLYVAIDTSNFNLGSGSTTLTAKLNGTAITGSSFSSAAFSTSDSQRVYRIDSMPQGEIELTFTVIKGAEKDVVTRTFNFNPISSIQVTNTFNGAVFYGTGLAELKGKLLNFNLATDIGTVAFKLNGAEIPLTAAMFNGSQFTIPLLNADTSSKLVFGSNELVLSGRANGVYVTNTLLIYRFSDQQPAVTKLVPVPYKIDPTQDTGNTRYQSDIDNKFILGDKADNYVTTQKSVDLLFTVAKLANLIVTIDGQTYATASVNASDQLVYQVANKLFLEPDGTDTNNKTYRLRLYNVPLPVTGASSITVTSQVGTESVSQTVTITRERPTFEILSPKLPQEAVINQNFLNVSILAEGADSVTIGKNEMNKSLIDDIFRYEMTGLKAGVNKVKFTVIRGTQKINGEFSVNYAADNSPGAQFKTSITKAGKASAFKGEVSVNFPKNTFLRKANESPGQDVTTIDMFDNQQVLFAIADRADGRTVKTYNAVGEYTGGTQSVAKDGTFVQIGYDDYGAAVLRPSAHFGYASKLFWIDPGYVDGTKSTGYTFHKGTQPYDLTNLFHQRPLSRWLETTNPGRITLKYDSGIINTAANTLSIWRYYNGQWTNMGGKVNAGSKTITTPIDGFGYYVVMQLRYSFTDIIGHSYARNSMELMFARGVMISTSNNEFGVYDNITRGEFAQLLVKMFQIPLDYNPNDMTFDDVIPVIGISRLWDYRYIETAVRKGIIRGKGPRQFLPNEALTREEAAVMIARAANLLKDGKDDQTKDRATLQKQFTDANSIDGYSLSSVIAVVKAKFLEGLPNTTTGTAKPTYRFDPKANLKRGDAAIIAERVMRKNKLL